MIVFGHYSIPMRTIAPNELPPAFQAEAGATIQSVVRVAHLMWIPVFPLQKTWTMKKGDQRYLLTPQACTLLDQLFGKPKMPWYAFALPLLILVGSTYYEFSSIMSSRKHKAEQAQNMEKRKQEYLNNIATPTENDYYSFILGEGRKIVLKVQSDQQDSIVFLSPFNRSENLSLYSESSKVGFFMNPSSEITTCTFAKSDLGKVLQTNPLKREFVGSGPISAFFVGQKVLLETIERLDPEKIEASFTDEKTELDVQKAVTAWLKSCRNIDSSMMLIDTASMNYFKNMLKVARTDNFEAMKKFIESSEYPLSTYRYMLFTKYSYLLGSNPPTDLKDYCFYLKLLDEGMWTLDFDTKIAGNAEILDVQFSNLNKAKVAMKAPSNKLNRQETIRFNLVCRKESGKWKVNAVSTLSYSDTQIKRGMPYGSNQHKNYRQMVIDEVKKTGDDKRPVVVGAEWLY